MTNRAHDFINVARELNLTYDQILHVTEDALDLDAYDTHNVPANADVAAMDQALTDAQARFTSDDDYDDFKAEVRDELGIDDDYDLFND